MLNALLFGSLIAIAFASGMPTTTAAVMFVGGSCVSFLVGATLVLVETDEILERRRRELKAILPAARRAWKEQYARQKAEKEARMSAIAAERERIREAERGREHKRLVTAFNEARSQDVSCRDRNIGWLDGGGRFNLEIVGESHYQDALERVCGGRTGQSQDLIVSAVLVLDDNNRYDPNAVRVEIRGLTVGYLWAVRKLELTAGCGWVEITFE